MNKLIIALALFTIAAGAIAAETVHVDGYMRKDGTYVAPHYRTAPDHNRANNWSSQGNVNPYTGEQGTVNPYAIQPPQPIYGSPPPRRSGYGQ